MASDWAAVAAAIQARLAELDMSQADLASRAGVAPETVRELRTNLKPRRRSPRTLTAISEALGWPGDHLSNVLRGGQRAAQSSENADNEVQAITRELAWMSERLKEISVRLGNLDR
jgi:transcriptional regulator with XRE-family HTH domain